MTKADGLGKVVETRCEENASGLGPTFLVEQIDSAK